MADGDAQIVYGDLDETAGVRGKLFGGLKFWIAQRCPLRNTFVDMVKSNGGTVVPLEKLADYLIVDHARKDTPPGGISYRFIEESIRNSRLEDPETHAVGPPVGTIRDVGSIRPKKGGRTPYTQADDLELYRWVKACERQGCSVLGNEIYKQLEAKNSRHPWQSWRDRYVKQLQYKPPAGYSPQDENLAPDAAEHAPRNRSVTNGHSSSRAPNSRLEAAASLPSRAQPRQEGEVKHQPGRSQKPAVKARVSSPSFTAAEFNEVLRGAKNIQETSVEDYGAAWGAWAEASRPGITGSQWRTFYETKVLPVFKAVRDRPRRISLYNDLAAAWTKLYPDGTADEWLDYYHGKVLARLDEVKDTTKKPSEEQAGSQSPERPGAIHQSPSPTPPKEAPQIEPEPTATMRTRGSQRRMSPSVVIPVRSNGHAKPQPSPLFVSDDVSPAEESDTNHTRPIAKAHEFFAVQFEAHTREDHPGADDAKISRILLARYGALAPAQKAAYEFMEARDKERWRRETAALRASKKRVRESEEIAESPVQVRKTPNGKRRRLSEEDLAQLDGHASKQVTPSEQGTPSKTRVQLVIELSEDVEKEEDVSSDDDDITPRGEPSNTEQVQPSIEDDEALPEGFPPAGVYTRDEDEFEVGRLVAMNDIDENNEDAEAESSGNSSNVEEDEGPPPIETMNQILLKDDAALREGRVELVGEVLLGETINETLLEDEEEAQSREQEQYEDEKMDRISPYIEAPATPQTKGEGEEDEDMEEEEDDEPLGRPASPSLSNLGEPIQPREKKHQNKFLPSLEPLTSSPPPAPQGPARTLPAQPFTQLPPVRPLSSSLPDPTPPALQRPTHPPTTHPLSRHDLYRSSSPPDPTLPNQTPPDSAQPKSLGPRPSSPLTGPLTGPALEAHIDALVSAGHEEELVVASLYATSTNPRLAAVVLAAMEAGEEVPDDVRGIWTEEDDEVVFGADVYGVEVARVMEKHGERRCRERVEFLRLWREGDSQEESQGKSQR